MKTFKREILSAILSIVMILLILPAFNVSAAVTEIAYYEHNFELPLYGATGCPVKDVAGIAAGTPVTILEEQSGNMKVRLQSGAETTIDKQFCMINLPDVIPSIVYRDRLGWCEKRNHTHERQSIYSGRRRNVGKYKQGQ